MQARGKKHAAETGCCATGGYRLELGIAMNDDYDRREELRAEYAEELYAERKARYSGCKCGNPDWPGHCPGWQQCPLQQEDENE